MPCIVLWWTRSELFHISREIRRILYVQVAVRCNGHVKYYEVKEFEFITQNFVNNVIQNGRCSWWFFNGNGLLIDFSLLFQINFVLMHDTSSFIKKNHEINKSTFKFYMKMCLLKKYSKLSEICISSKFETSEYINYHQYIISYDVTK